MDRNIGDLINMCLECNLRSLDYYQVAIYVDEHAKLRCFGDAIFRILVLILGIILLYAIFMPPP